MYQDVYMELDSLRKELRRRLPKCTSCSLPEKVVVANPGPLKNAPIDDTFRMHEVIAIPTCILNGEAHEWRWRVKVEFVV